MSPRDGQKGSERDSLIVEDHRRGQPAEVLAMAERFLAVVQSCLGVRVAPQTDIIVLRDNQRIRASLRMTGHGLRGHLHLPRRIADLHFTKVEPLTKQLLFRRFALGSLAEIDDAFVESIREACTSEPDHEPSSRHAAN